MQATPPAVLKNESKPEPVTLGRLPSGALHVRASLEKFFENEFYLERGITLSHKVRGQFPQLLQSWQEVERPVL
jgi:hypothetical protein